MPDAHPLRTLGEKWLHSRERPRPSSRALAQMHALVVGWSENARVPLIVRRTDGRRGQALTHESRRKLVLVDNSPANWVYACALKHDLPDLMQGLRGGTLPVAFFLPKPEALKARYPNPLPKAYPKSLNPQWEECHIDDAAGRMFRGNILQTPIEDLKERMILLMSPANMFLVHGHAGRGNPLG